MGLPSYIINFEDVKPYIIEAINEAVISAELGEVTLNADQIKIDISSIQAQLNEIIKYQHDQTRYILEGRNILDIISELLEELKDSHGEQLQNLTDKIIELCEYTEKTNRILTAIGDIIGGFDGKQKAIGRKINVLSQVTNLEYRIVQNIPKDSILTAVTIASTSYTDVDNWSLYIGKNSAVPVFESIYIKPLGDRKEFRKTIAIPGGQDLVLVFNNLSQSGKTIFVDFEYIELNDK